MSTPNSPTCPVRRQSAVDEMGHLQGDPLYLTAHGGGAGSVQSQGFLQERLQPPGVAAAEDVGDEAAATADARAGAGDAQHAVSVPLHQHSYVEDAAAMTEQVDLGLNEPRPPGSAEQHVHQLRKVAVLPPRMRQRASV